MHRQKTGSLDRQRSHAAYTIQSFRMQYGRGAHTCPHTFRIALDGQSEQLVATQVAHYISVDPYLIDRPDIAGQHASELRGGELTRISRQCAVEVLEERLSQRRIAGNVPAQMIDGDDAHGAISTPHKSCRTAVRDGSRPASRIPTCQASQSS